MDETETNKEGASRRTVLGGAVTLTALTLAGGAGQAFAQGRAAAGPFAGKWWEKDYRIIQTNNLETDVLQNPRDIVKAVKDFGGTAIVSNIGGIVAFYPTKLEYQYQNPYMKGDFCRDMIEACHAEGIAYLGRFDTSKGTKKVYDAHPDWFGIYSDGQPTEYAGTYQACPNGAWLQDYAMQILREALTTHKPDAVFFNGVGFGVNDYGGRNRGQCVCNNCRTAFRKASGLELPKAYNLSDPNYPTYVEWTERVVAEVQGRMHKLADELIPGAPIFRGEDYEYVGRGEMQRRVNRPAPEWPYQGGEQARSAIARTPGKPFSSTSSAHIDYPWRQVVETADNHILRFAQQLGNGAHLDLYLMGTLQGQDDQAWLPPVSKLFKWEAANSQHYAKTKPNSRIAMWISEADQRYTATTPFGRYRAGSARGAYAALIDSRMPFQFVSGDKVVEGVSKLSDFDVVVLPHVVCIGDKEAAALDAFVSAGGLLIASGMTGAYDDHGKARTAAALASFPLASYDKPQEARGWVLDSAKSPLKYATNPTPIDEFYFGGPLRDGVDNLVPFVPDIRWGPPEYSYVIPGSKPRTIPGVAARKHGNGYAVHIPWLNDWQYNRDGLQVNQQLLASLVRRYAPAQPYTLTGNGAVELTALQSGGSNTLLHVINYAGQRNGRYDTPPNLAGLSVGVKTGFRSARSLVTGKALTPRAGAGGYRWLDLEPVGAFDAILLEG
jgi:hypothetical protein